MRPWGGQCRRWQRRGIRGETILGPAANDGFICGLWPVGFKFSLRRARLRHEGHNAAPEGAQQGDTAADSNCRSFDPDEIYGANVNANVAQHAVKFVTEHFN